MPAKRWLIAILAWYAPLPAQAAAIANLTEAPQLIAVAGQAISIAPGATWRTPGRVVVAWHGHDIAIEDDMEFAIWPGGDFGPQRRINITHKGL